MAEYIPETLLELLVQSETRHKSENAFLLKDAGGALYTISYEQFKNEVEALSSAILDLNKGKTIGIFMSNSYEWCCAFMAAVCIGGTAVPIEKTLSSRELYNIIEFAEIDIIITDEKGIKILFENKALLQRQILVVLNSNTPYEDTKSYKELIEKGKELLSSDRKIFDNITISPDDTAALFFTSGTTGMTKAVMLSHKNLCSDLVAVSDFIKIYEGDVAMSVLPLNHTYELISYLMVVYSGASVSFCESLRTLQDDFNFYRPTVFVTVPLILEKIDSKILAKMQQSGKRNVAKLISKVSPVIPKDSKRKIFSDVHAFFGGRVRMIICGAASLKKETAVNFSSYGIPVIIGYGLTECSPIVICNNDLEPTYDSVGKPLPGVKIKIDSPDENGIGEICVKGNMVMKGYFKAPGDTEKVMKNGFFHTGDSGYKDSDGNYHICGRLKNIIVTRNGKNIYPEEVEYYLSAHPYIAECVVYSEGDIVAAEILPDIKEIKRGVNKDTLLKDEIHSAIKEAVRAINRTIPSYKRIKKLTVRDEAFDKTSTHKIKR